MKFIKQYALFFCLGLGMITPVIAAPTFDRMVAVVNDGVITQSQLNQQLGMARQQIQHNHVPMPAAGVLRKQVLDHMIDQQLQLQVAKQSGITADKAAVDRALTQIAQQNGLTLAQLPEKMKEAGIDFSQFRAQIQQQLIIHQVQQREVGSTVSLTEQENKNAHGDRNALEAVYQRKFEAAVKNWVEKLRKQGYVKIVNP